MPSNARRDREGKKREKRGNVGTYRFYRTSILLYDDDDDDDARTGCLTTALQWRPVFLLQMKNVGKNIRTKK